MGRRGLLCVASVILSLIELGYCVEDEWPRCDDVPQKAAAAATLCGVDNILRVRDAILMDGATANLCESECVNAVKDVALSATDCFDSDLDVHLGVSQSRVRLSNVVTTQNKCSPPSLECFRTFRDMNNFQHSSRSQSCIDLMADAANETRLAVAQAKSQAFCHGVCGVNISYYLDTLENLGCVQWDAYRETKLKYELACHLVNGQYCASVFNEDKYRDDIRSILYSSEALNTTTVTEQESQLSSICSPCFQEHVRLTNRYTTIGNERLLVLEKMCVQDGSRYCYPRYQFRKQNREFQSVIEYAHDICDIDYMGQCAGKMQLRELLDLKRTNQSQEEIRQLQTDVDSMCVLFPGGSGGTDLLCVDAMQSIVGGYYENKSFVGSEYSGPSSCSSLTANSSCSWACQETYTTDRDNFGCCYETIKTYLANLNFTNSVFETSDLIGSECNREPLDACTEFDTETQAQATIIFEAPLWFFQTNETVKDFALNDIMRTTGFTTSGVAIKGFRYRSHTSTFVDFTITGQDSESVLSATSRVTTDASNGLIVNLDSDYEYNLRCHQSGGIVCSSAMASASNFMLIIATTMAYFMM
eukprot:m.22032 g.22032  ORF g.22032 m.22032 type:complete len:588 (+) comp13661_c0_seq1:210-1973(+)